jgi:hypothetical protein
LKAPLASTLELVKWKTVCSQILLFQIQLLIRYVMVMGRVRGIKLLSVLNRARQRWKRPACPAVAAARHANGGIGWVGLCHSRVPDALRRRPYRLPSIQCDGCFVTEN